MSIPLAKCVQTPGRANQNHCLTSGVANKNINKLVQIEK